MLPQGSTIPEITIPPTPGLCDEPTTLRDLAAQGPIVIYSYPADGTPMCTRQACMVRDTVAEHAEALKDAGLRVVGISPQGTESHERFSARHNLAFPIIADKDKAILRALEALGPLGIPRRVTYLLRTDGAIGDAITADLRLSRHTKFIRKALESAKH